MKILGEAPLLPSGARAPFSPAVQTGNLVLVSGQLPMIDGKVVGDNITEQSEALFDNVQRALELAGRTLDNVVKCTIWLVDAADFVGFNAVYAAKFGSHAPARSTVVSALVIPGARVEMEVVAEI